MSKSHKLDVAFLTIAVAIVMTGFGIIFPIFPKLLTFLDSGSAEQLGIISAAYGITFVISSPIFGNLADRFGKKRIITFGLFGFTISNLIYIFAVNYYMVLIARAIEGMFSSALIPPAIAMVSELSPENRQAKYIGYLTAGQTVGLIIGPILGGFLFKYGVHAPFYASAMLAGIAFTWGFFKLPDGKIINNEINSIQKLHFEPIKALIRQIKVIPNPKFIFIIFIIVEMFSILCWLFAEPGFSFHIYNDLHLTPEDFGIFVTFYGIVTALSQTFFGGLSDKYGRRPIIFLGLIFNLLFFILLDTARTLPQLILASSTAGLSAGLANPALKATITSATTENTRATVLGIESGLISISQVVGPILGGRYYDLYGMKFVIFISILISIIALLLCVFIKFKNPKSSIQTKYIETEQIYPKIESI